MPARSMSLSLRNFSRAVRIRSEQRHFVAELTEQRLERRSSAAARGFRSAPESPPDSRFRPPITAASAATIVAPLPTSPCMRRLIGLMCEYRQPFRTGPRFCAQGGLEGQQFADPNVRARGRSAGTLCPGMVRARQRLISSRTRAGRIPSKMRQEWAGERKSLSIRIGVPSCGKYAARAVTSMPVWKFQLHLHLGAAGNLRVRHLRHAPRGCDG